MSFTNSINTTTLKESPLPNPSKVTSPKDLNIILNPQDQVPEKAISYPETKKRTRSPPRSTRGSSARNKQPPPPPSNTTNEVKVYGSKGKASVPDKVTKDVYEPPSSSDDSNDFLPDTSEFQAHNGMSLSEKIAVDALMQDKSKPKKKKAKKTYSKTTATSSKNDVENSGKWGGTYKCNCGFRSQTNQENRCKECRGRISWICPGCNLEYAQSYQKKHSKRCLPWQAWFAEREFTVGSEKQNPEKEESPSLTPEGSIASSSSSSSSLKESSQETKDISTSQQQLENHQDLPTTTTNDDSITLQEVTTKESTPTTTTTSIPTSSSIPISMPIQHRDTVETVTSVHPVMQHQPSIVKVEPPVIDIVDDLDECYDSEEEEEDENFDQDPDSFMEYTQVPTNFRPATTTPPLRKEVSSRYARQDEFEKLNNNPSYTKTYDYQGRIVYIPNNATSLPRSSSLRNTSSQQSHYQQVAIKPSANSVQQSYDQPFEEEDLPNDPSTTTAIDENPDDEINKLVSQLLKYKKKLLAEKTFKEEPSSYQMIPYHQTQPQAHPSNKNLIIYNPNSFTTNRNTNPYYETVNALLPPPPSEVDDSYPRSYNKYQQEQDDFSRSRAATKFVVDEDQVRSVLERNAELQKHILNLQGKIQALKKKKKKKRTVPKREAIPNPLPSIRRVEENTFISTRNNQPPPSPPPQQYHQPQRQSRVTPLPNSIAYARDLNISK